MCAARTNYLQKSKILDYFFAVFLVLSFTGIRLVVQPVLQKPYPFLFYFLALLLSGWFGGFGPSCVATLLSAGFTAAFFIPHGEWAVPVHREDGLALLLFLCIGLIFGVITEILHRKSRQAENTQRELQSRLEMERAMREDLLSAKAEADYERRRLEGILEALPVGVVLSDAQGKFLKTNAAISDIWGACPEMEGVEHYKTFKGFWLDSGKQLEAEDWALARALRQKIPVRDVVNIERFDGTIGRIITTAIPILNESGALLGGVVACTDITVQMESEEKLRRSEALYRTVARSIPNAGVFLVDRDFRFLMIEGEGVRHLTLGSAFVEGKTLDECLADEPQVLERVKSRFGRALAGEQLSVELEHGERAFWLEYAPLRDTQGEVFAAMALVLDVTDRRRAERAQREVERALAESDRRFRRAVTGAPFPLMIHAEGGEVVTVNRAWTEITGYTQQDIPTIRDWAERAYGSKRDDVAKYISGLYELTEKKDEGEYVIATSTGAQRVWHFSSAPLGRDRQNRRLVISMAMDVTRRKQAEEALAQAKNEAEEASRAKSLFLANISHEIRTPLSAILGFTDLLRDDFNLPVEKRTHFIDVIANSGEQLSFLINDILDLSKAEAGRLDLDQVCFCLPDVIDEVKMMFAARAEQKQISLQCFAPDPSLAIYSDRMRVKQIIINIVGNALKFTQKNGVVKLSLEHDKEKQQVKLFVSDTGVGIPKERWNQIFEPFNHGDHSMIRKFGGTGLGLSFSRKLARLLRGDLQLVESVVDTGSVFQLILPAVLCAPEEDYPSL